MISREVVGSVPKSPATEIVVSVATLHEDGHEDVVWLDVRDRLVESGEYRRGIAIPLDRKTIERVAALMKQAR